MSFVIAVNSNGTKQRIPIHWLDHPVLGKPFRMPKSAQGTTEQTSDPLMPDQSWTIPQIRAYAEKHEIDLSGLTLKPDLLAAVTQ